MKYKYRKAISWTKSFLIWALVYFVVLWLFYNLINPSISSFSFIIKYKIIYYLIFGLFVILLSTLINAGIKRKKFVMGQYLIYWTIIYSFLLWVLDFLFNQLVNTGSFNFLNNPILKILVLSLILALALKFVRRIDFPSGHGRGLRMPRISFGFFVAIGILVVAYYYSQSIHFLAYSMAYGIPLFVFWIVAVILAFFAWRSIDN